MEIDFIMVNLAHLLLILLPFIAMFYRKKHPDSAFNRILWGTIGPRTDVANMTSEEIFGAARFFFVTGGYFLGIIFLSFLLLKLNEPDNQQEGIRLFLFILPVFFCLMGFIGSLFLFISGLFKKD